LIGVVVAPSEPLSTVCAKLGTSGAATTDAIVAAATAARSDRRVCVHGCLCNFILQDFRNGPATAGDRSGLTPAPAGWTHFSYAARCGRFRFGEDLVKPQ
jgi:hypothetical protein